MLSRWRIAAATVLSIASYGLSGLAAASDQATFLVLDPRALEIVRSGALESLVAGNGRSRFGVAVAAAGQDAGYQGWLILRAPGQTTPLTVPAMLNGRFALDAALRAAAAELDYTEKPAHIVLVAAGGPQGISVACSLSQTLAADARQLRVDVMGLSPSAIRLRCIAENTGGDYRAADLASIPTLLEAALVQPVGPAAIAATETGLAGAATGIAPTADDTAALSSESADRVPIPPKPPDAPPQRADVDELSRLSDDRPAADRLTVLAWAETKTDSEISAAPLPPTGDVTGVQLRAVASPGGAPLTSELSFEVLALEGDGAFRLVGRSWAPQPVFDLPAGEYVARVTHSGVVREHKFRSSGEGLEQRTLSLDLGYVSLATSAMANMAPLESDLTYTLRRIDGGAPLVRYDPQPLLALPAGEYKVAVTSGAAQADATIRVVPGETTTKTFDLGLGFLRLSAGVSHIGPVQFRVEQMDGQSEASTILAEAEGRSGEAQLFRLPAGQHIVIAESEGMTVRQLVTIAPGKLTQITLDPQTAQAATGLGNFSQPLNFSHDQF